MEENQDLGGGGPVLLNTHVTVFPPRNVQAMAPRTLKLDTSFSRRTSQRRCESGCETTMDCVSNGVFVFVESALRIGMKPWFRLRSRQLESGAWFGFVIVKVMFESECALAPLILKVRRVMRHMHDKKELGWRFRETSGQR